VALVGWLVDAAAVGYGWGDADGFVDCRDSCTATHYTAAFGFFAGPLFFILAVAALVVERIIVRRRHDRSSAAPR
jgi:hypothetical protein